MILCFVNLWVKFKVSNDLISQCTLLQGRRHEVYFFIINPTFLPNNPDLKNDENMILIPEPAKKIVDPMRYSLHNFASNN